MTDQSTQDRLEMLAARRSATTPKGKKRQRHPAIGSRIAVTGFGATATLGMVAAFTMASSPSPENDTVAAAPVVEQTAAPTSAPSTTTTPTTQEPIKLTLPPTTAPETTLVSRAVPAPVVTQAPRSAAPTAPPAPAPTAPPTQSSGS